MRNEQSCPQAPSEARDNAHGQARRWRACRVKGQSPLWVQGKALSEFEAEPHSAQADKVQIVVSKADRNRISDESDIGELNLHRLSIPKRNVDTQRAERFCGGRTCPNICRGDLVSPVFRIYCKFRIVGERRNFCFAEI